MTRQKKSFPTELLRTVAEWFYTDERTKQEIAKTLKIDTRQVRAMLEEAREKRIVRIYISHSIAEGLSQRLVQEFPHLQKVLITPTGRIKTVADYVNLLRQWGAVAANYFDDLVDEGEDLFVGVSGGETLLEFVDALADMRRDKVHVITTTLLGRATEKAHTTAHVDPLVIATMLWAKCGRLPGRCRYATVPPYGDNISGPGGRAAIAAELTQLKKRQPISTILSEMDEINVAFASLGVVNPQGILAKRPHHFAMTSMLKGIGHGDLAKEGAVGDISYCLFNKRGETEDRWKFFLSAGSLQQKTQGAAFYRRMVERGDRVVVIGGLFKEKAIKAALHAKLFNVWITDEATARSVLK